jgi:hypothetical protein
VVHHRPHGRPRSKRRIAHDADDFGGAAACPHLAADRILRWKQLVGQLLAHDDLPRIAAAILGRKRPAPKQGNTEGLEVIAFNHPLVNRHERRVRSAVESLRPPDVIEVEHR